MKEFAVLRAKTYSYLTDNNNEDKKQKAQKGKSEKENLNLKIKNFLEATQTENRKNIKKNS